MDERKRKRLEEKGWAVGDAADFLQLSPVEAALVDLKARLAAALRRVREAQGMTQGDLAEALASSQSRVSKMEAAAGPISTDLLLRGLFAAGASTHDIARAIDPGESSHR